MVMVSGGWAKLYENREWLTKRYQVDKRKPEEIAKESGVSVATIYRWLKKFGLLNAT